MLEAFEYVHYTKMQSACKTESIFLIEPAFELTPYLSCMVKGPPEIYKCEDCAFEAYLKVNLKVHVEMMHQLGVEVPIDSFCTFADSTYNLTNILKCYTCKCCSFMTFSLLVLLKHESKDCQFTEKVIKLREMPMERKVTFHSTPRPYTNVPKQFECEVCNVRSNSKYHMAKHIELKHTPFGGAEWFKCEQCSFKTRHKGNLRGHKLQHMSVEDIKWYQCSFCPHKAKQKKHLQVHIIAKHTPLENIKWFECAKCSYKAKCSSALNGHVKARHTAPEDIKWVHCELCSYKCKRRSQLKQHMRMKGVHKGY